MALLFAASVANYIVIKKHNYMGMFLMLLYMSFGTILNSMFPNFTSIIALEIFMIVLCFRVNIKNVNSKWLYRNAIFIILPLMLYLFNVYSTDSMMNTIYVLVVIPCICEWTLESLSENKKEFVDIYKYYILINLMILIYRAFIDYSFFGYMINSRTFSKYSEYYLGSGFRPANLTSPIIFSIELVICMYLVIAKNGLKNSSILFLVLSIVSVGLMRSRSSIVLLLMLTIYIALFTGRRLSFGKTSIFLALIGLLVFASLKFGLWDLLTFSESSYSGRFNSIGNVVQKFSMLPFINQIFGLGFGAANKVVDGTMEFYVENFFVALLINLGVLGCVTYFASFLIAFICAIKYKRFQSFIILFGLVVVNNFSSNMTSYLIQSVYWFAFYYTISKRETIENDKSFDWIKSK